MAAGATVNIKGRMGFTPLHWAADKGYNNFVKMFVSSGADVNAQSTYGYTALMEAALEGHDMCIKTLIESGADVNRRTSQGETALMYAVRNASAKSVQLVVQSGADVNILDGYGNSLLHNFLRDPRSSQDVVGCIKSFFTAGAPVNVTNNRGQTLGECAKNSIPRYKILKLLFAAGENINVATSSVNKRLPEEESTIEIVLSFLCRKAIRKHLLEVDPHGNLLFRVPRLGLPVSLIDYLLYNMYND